MAYTWFGIYNTLERADKFIEFIYSFNYYPLTFVGEGIIYSYSIIIVSSGSNEDAFIFKFMEDWIKGAVGKFYFAFG